MPNRMRGSIRAITDNLSGNIREKYLTFTIDRQLFAVPILDVVQIIGRYEVTEIPDYPSFVKGIIHLRGTILPIIDMRVRFHKEESAYHDRICILVTKIQDKKIGLIVDTVDNVLNIRPDCISDPYYFSESIESHFLSGVAQIEGTTILLLDIRKIINKCDFNRLADSIESHA